MTDLVWPRDLVPYKVLFYLQPHVGGQESPLTRTRKVYGLSAPRWVARYTFRAGDDGSIGTGSYAPRLDAMLAILEGGLTPIRLWDFRRPRSQRQQLVASPVGLTVQPAAIGATSLPVAGFSPNSLAFSTGDYVGGDGRAHLVTAACYADGAGVARPIIKPALQAAVTAAPAAVQEVTSLFQLMSVDAGAVETEMGQPTEYVLEFTEKLP